VQAAAGPPAACAFDPLVAQGAAGDGQFALHAAVANHQGSDPSPFLSVAEEAAVQGRSRDSEVALIAACRVAAKAGAATAPVAEVQTRLAQHYTALATREREQAARRALVERADGLLAASVTGYEQSLGREASRTRLAAQRLAVFRQGSPALVSGVAETVPPTQGQAQGDPGRADATGTLGAARQSLAERPARQDEELPQVDADLERLYEQARSVSRDPAGLQRRHQQALAQRQACRTEACLREWYSQRRRQLFSEF
jgi:hypothetical protein